MRQSRPSSMALLATTHNLNGVCAMRGADTALGNASSDDGRVVQVDARNGDAALRERRSMSAKDERTEKRKEEAEADQLHRESSRYRVVRV